MNEEVGTDGGADNQADGAPERSSRIDQVLMTYLQGQSEGDDDEDLMDQHPELMPELAERLRELREIADQRHANEGLETLGLEEALDDATIDHPSSTGRDQGVDRWDSRVADLSAAWHPHDQPMIDYRLSRRLGAGGMGEVWKAEGPGGIPIALKRVDLRGQFGQRELDALELLKQVRHPHLLSVHGYWIQAGLLIIGLELADESLRELLDRQQNGLSVEQVIAYLTDAAEALDYLGRPIHCVNDHAVCIQHRDVKPANLLIQGGAVKVGDFGLAKALRGVVQDHSLSMTVQYAPPEFFRGQTEATSDQYSLGVSYY